MVPVLSPEDRLLWFFALAQLAFDHADAGVVCFQVVSEILGGAHSLSDAHLVEPHIVPRGANFFGGDVLQMHEHVFDRLGLAGEVGGAERNIWDGVGGGFRLANLIFDDEFIVLVALPGVVSFGGGHECRACVRVRRVVCDCGLIYKI